MAYCKDDHTGHTPCSKGTDIPTNGSSLPSAVTEMDPVERCPYDIWSDGSDPDAVAHDPDMDVAIESPHRGPGRIADCGLGASAELCCGIEAHDTFCALSKYGGKEGMGYKEKLPDTRADGPDDTTDTAVVAWPKILGKLRATHEDTGGVCPGKVVVGSAPHGTSTLHTKGTWCDPDLTTPPKVAPDGTKPPSALRGKS